MLETETVSLLAKSMRRPPAEIIWVASAGAPILLRTIAMKIAVSLTAVVGAQRNFSHWKIVNSLLTGIHGPAASRKIGLN